MVPDFFERRALTKTEKVAVWSSAAFVLLLGVTHPGAPAQPDQATPVGLYSSTTDDELAEEELAEKPVADEITVEDVIEKSPLPFERQTVDDPNSPSGTTVISTAGVNGELT